MQVKCLRNTPTTQKQNNQVYNQKYQDYEKAQADFKKKLEEFRHGHNVSNPNGVSTAEIIQQLQLGREPQAKVAVSELAGKAGLVDDTKQVGVDSTSYQYLFDGSVPGTALVATYTNLKNSYYTDDSGVKHHISKIIRTFSNLTADNSINWQSFLNFINNAQFNFGKPYLWIYDDPTDGFWYNFSSGVTVDDQYFDENGNPVNIGNNAWLAATSLNNSGYNEDNKSEISSNTHIEKCTPIDGATAYGMLGSSVTNNNGSLYSVANNSNGSGLNDGNNWDNATNPNRYYGTGLIKLNGTHSTLRFETANTDSATIHPTYRVWATTTTIVPETPGPKYKGPKKPEPKSSSIHYHYDTNYSNTFSMDNFF